MSWQERHIRILQEYTEQSISIIVDNSQEIDPFASARISIMQDAAATSCIDMTKGIDLGLQELPNGRLGVDDCFGIGRLMMFRHWSRLAPCRYWTSMLAADGLFIAPGRAPPTA